MIRALMLTLAVVAAGPARSQCLLFCDPEVPAAEASERLANWIGPLPAGVEIVGMVEDGFQDTLIQARLSVDDGELTALLALLEVRPEELIPQVDLYMGPEAAPWFDWQSQSDLRASNGRSPGLTHLTIAVAPEPDLAGQWKVYLWGFTT